MTNQNLIQFYPDQIDNALGYVILGFVLYAAVIVLRRQYYEEVQELKTVPALIGDVGVLWAVFLAGFLFGGFVPKWAEETFGLLQGLLFGFLLFPSYLAFVQKQKAKAEQRKNC